MQPPGLTQLAPGHLEIRGPLTFATVATLYRREAVPPADGGQLRIDLQHVTRADSAGLALMLEWQRTARLAGGRIEFVGMPEQLRALIKVIGVAHLFSDAEA